MARDCKDEREEPSICERARGTEKSVSDRVMVRESERDRVMAINS